MRPGLWLYRYRSYTPLPLFVLAVWQGDPSGMSVALGFAICAIGEVIRIWGVATAGALTRMQDAPGGDVLVTNGPFAFVRNPLYVANIILYAGVGVMSGAWWIPVAAIVGFCVQYGFIIREEERYLAAQFGARYVEYCRQVRRFAPRLAPYRDGTGAAPVWKHPRDLWRTERSTFRAIAAATLIMGALAFFQD